MTLPLKVALTGPTLARTLASARGRRACSSSSQPGIDALRISGSFSASQTRWRGAVLAGHVHAIGLLPRSHAAAAGCARLPAADRRQGGAGGAAAAPLAQPCGPMSIARGPVGRSEGAWMLGHLSDLLSSEEFMPHGMCFLWRPDLIWLHAVATVSSRWPTTRSRSRCSTSSCVGGISRSQACSCCSGPSSWPAARRTSWGSGPSGTPTTGSTAGQAGHGRRLGAQRRGRLAVMPAALALPSSASSKSPTGRWPADRGALPAEEGVRRLNQELEQRVAERTADLEASNARLRAARREGGAAARGPPPREEQPAGRFGPAGLQARNAPPALGQYFQESLERIHAMGRVHEQLYRADDARRSSSSA